jgi:hypothetical protein
MPLGLENAVVGLWTVKGQLAEIFSVGSRNDCSLYVEAPQGLWYWKVMTGRVKCGNVLVLGLNVPGENVPGQKVP